MTQLNTLFFCVLLPLWVVAVTVNLGTLYKRNRAKGDFTKWGRYHFIHSLSQAATIGLGVALGFFGAEVIRQW